MSGRIARAAAYLAVPALLAVAIGVGVHVGGAAEDADVNARRPDGSTPLQWAVYDNDVEEVRRLIKAGADVRIANDYGATPMSLAAEVANTEILKLLLDAGADVESPNADG